jgi:hypothetical protein
VALIFCFFLIKQKESKREYLFYLINQQESKRDHLFCSIALYFSAGQLSIKQKESKRDIYFDKFFLNKTKETKKQKKELPISHCG